MSAVVGISIIMALAVGAGASLILDTISDKMASHQISVTILVAIVFIVSVIRRLQKKANCSFLQVNWVKEYPLILDCSTNQLVRISAIVSALFLLAVLSASLAISFAAILNFSAQARDIFGWSAFFLLSGYCLRFIHWFDH